MIDHAIITGIGDMSTKVQIKGIREGLLVTLGEGSWDELHPVLLEHLDQQAGFLQGARLALDVGNLVLKAADLGQLTKEISERGLTLWAVIERITYHRAQHPILWIGDTAFQTRQGTLLRLRRSGSAGRGDCHPGAPYIAFWVQSAAPRACRRDW